ncbi:MAG: class GN sortase [Gammaproteobacteria bacterium]|nr:class GN sortase [Gammaproteobacteria bacterium]MCW8924310.1 class GN sortase [Gammaproteobacteria bacterium]
MNINKLLVKVAILVFVVFGAWHLSCAVWIAGKAYAASFLINDAWQKTLRNKHVNKPWSWADTWPVAQITIQSIGLDEIVLAGDSGASLAFGPGLSYAGASLDEDGIKLISGHRDTHFSKLKNININDVIFVKTPLEYKQYKVKDIGIVDSRTHLIETDEISYDLVLATCYPFNSVSSGGSERFIVEAVEL